MKLSAKIWLITAAALVLAGSIVFAGVMAANHWDFTATAGAKYETEVFDISGKFENISVHSDTADIMFLPSDDGTCKVIFYEQPKIKCSALVGDRTLLIETVDTRKWYEQISLFGSSKITVYLPESEYTSLLIEESTGDVVIPDGFTFEDIAVSASTGNVYCGASSSGMTRIGTSTGSIRIENTSAGALELSVSTGRVEVCSVVCAGNMGIDVSTGKAFLTDISCGDLVSGGDTGDMTLKNVIAAGVISIERSTGDISFDCCDAAELNVKTDTGDVTGTLLSKKVFTAQSDTGRIEVPESAAGGKCRITTDTGDIVIAVQ